MPGSEQKPKLEPAADATRRPRAARGARRSPRSSGPPRPGAPSTVDGAARPRHVGHVEREAPRARPRCAGRSARAAARRARGRASARRASRRRARPCAPRSPRGRPRSRATGSGSSERQLEGEERVAVALVVAGVVEAHRDLHAHAPRRPWWCCDPARAGRPATAVSTASLTVAPAIRLAASCSSRSGARAKATSRRAPIVPSNGERSGPSASSWRRNAGEAQAPAARRRRALDAARPASGRPARVPEHGRRRSASPTVPSASAWWMRQTSAAPPPRAVPRRCATAAATGRGARRTGARPRAQRGVVAGVGARAATTWASMSKCSSSTHSRRLGGPPRRRRSAGAASSRLRDRLRAGRPAPGPGRRAARPCTCARRPTPLSSSRIARSSAVSAMPSTGQLS